MLPSLFLNLLISGPDKTEVKVSCLNARISVIIKQQLGQNQALPYCEQILSDQMKTSPTGKGILKTVDALV